MTEQIELSLPQGITPTTENGLPAFRVATELATGLVYAHGAHVAAWAPAGADEVLWMSGSSVYDEASPLRGGIPICFPWFGPGRDGQHSPAHGFARLAQWNLVDAKVSEAGEARISLELRGDELAADALGDFPADFTARYDVTMGSELRLALTVTAGTTELSFEEALHSYFDVDDAKAVQVTGLEGSRYLDKVSGQQEAQDGPVTFTGETDRVYESTSSVQIADGRRAIEVAKTDSANTVVWNPWVAKSAAMADFGDDEWTGMCCVETANALEHAVLLGAGEAHTMTATISLA